MILIVGLGNPGNEYENTRHNMGFHVIDNLANKHGINVNVNKYRAMTGSGYIEGRKVLLVKPQTFMNASGESVRKFIDFYKISPKDDLIVIYDDIHLDVGRIRIRKNGSAGGHNGMKNIIAHLGTSDFPRVRVGVGRMPNGADQVKYVLGRPSKDELPILDEVYNLAAEGVRMMVEGELEGAMNLCNRKKKEKE